ncbi:glycosyltransferase [Brachybacterium nesterenkovii]|uniref:Glycosyl transferase family 2 n=1 Tax=Brachybacterium nesterenkovii TaxID=47847 RepID=A0A1X6X4A1_9MICO|nr:glycosyltransferase [Brachybacterium nesterenkovii]SLM93735.1 glycosyl transferase family 2 [Brachybacterium nesterenkovii]
MDTPDVTVVIPFSAALDTLPLQLAALAGQVDAPPFEVVIADNEGSAGLAELVAALAPVPPVRVVDASGRPGAAHARNAGAAAARGATLLFCDADDVVDPRWVAGLAAAVEPGRSFAAGCLRLDRLNPAWTLRPFLGLEPGPRLEAPVLQAPFAYLGYLPFGYSANLAMARTDLLALGGMDATLTCGEDVDLCWRAQESGLAMRTVPGAVVDYRLRTTLRDIFAQRRAYGRAQVQESERSLLLGRPVRRTSWSWALRELVRMPLQSLPATMRPGAAREDRVRAAMQYGGVVGAAEGLVRHRALRQGLGLASPRPGATGRALAPGRPLLILSPHLDDAVLSVSALLDEPGAEVWTVFAGVPADGVSTAWDRACGYDSGAELVRDRRLEDAAALAGIRHRHLDLLDRAYADPGERPQDLAELAAQLRAWLTEHPDGLLVAPSGAGVAVPSGPADRTRGAVRRLRGAARALRRRGAPTGSSGVPNGVSGAPIGPLTAALTAPDAREEGASTADAPPRCAPAPSRAAGGARAAARTGAQRLLHADMIRRRRRAEGQGMLANEDHAAVRETALDVAVSAGVDVVLYEDLPYGMDRPAESTVAAAARRTGRSARPVLLAPDRERKIARAAHYRSQIPQVSPPVGVFARALEPAAERLWLLEA